MFYCTLCTGILQGNVLLYPCVYCVMFNSNLCTGVPQGNVFLYPMYRCTSGQCFIATRVQVYFREIVMRVQVYRCTGKCFIVPLVQVYFREMFYCTACTGVPQGNDFLGFHNFPRTKGQSCWGGVYMLGDFFSSQI